MKPTQEPRLVFLSVVTIKAFSENRENIVRMRSDSRKKIVAQAVERGRFRRTLDNYCA